MRRGCVHSHGCSSRVRCVVAHESWACVFGLTLACTTLISSRAYSQESPAAEAARVVPAGDQERAAAPVQPTGVERAERAERSSYGYQIAITDGLLLPQVALSLWGMTRTGDSLTSVRGADGAWFGLSYSLELLAPVLIHGFNRASAGRIGWSLALRTVLPASFTAIGFGASLFKRQDEPSGWGVVGFSLGALLAAVLDDVLLARHPGGPPSGRTRRALAIVLLVASGLALATLATGTGLLLRRI